MALYLVISQDWTQKSETIQWHIGEKISRISENETVTLVQADGDELDYIKTHFSNIPFSHKRVNRWQGIFADFIGKNL